MIFKRLVLLALISNVSACALLSDNTQSTLPTATQKPGSLSGAENEVNAQNPETEDPSIKSPKAEAPLSEEAILAQELLSKPDLYVSQKRVLPDNVRSQVLEVLSFYQAKAYIEAQVKVRHIIASESELNSSVYVLAGDIAGANGESDKAFAYYQKAVEMDANNAKAANRLAMMMRDKGDFSEAEKLYTQAINAQPSHGPSYRNRAILNDLYLNNKQQALADYEAYSALLFYQAQQLNLATIALSDDELKSLKTDQKLVKRWLSDLQRQVKALARAAAKQSGGQ